MRAPPLAGATRHPHPSRARHARRSQVVKQACGTPAPSPLPHPHPNRAPRQGVDPPAPRQPRRGRGAPAPLAGAAGRGRGPDLQRCARAAAADRVRRAGQRRQRMGRGSGALGPRRGARPGRGAGGVGRGRRRAVQGAPRRPAGHVQEQQTWLRARHWAARLPSTQRLGLARRVQTVVNPNPQPQGQGAGLETRARQLGRRLRAADAARAVAAQLPRKGAAAAAGARRGGRRQRRRARGRRRRGGRGCGGGGRAGGGRSRALADAVGGAAFAAAGAGALSVLPFL